MTVTVLATYHVPEDSASSPPAGGGGGYVMACVTFYEQELGVPPHQFLHSLLQFYGLELHHLTPSGILHMATFVTLC
jgi:hypothetical protein